MKYFLTVFFLCFCLSGLLAQEKHFVFIQSDNNLPFYVSLNGKLYSSAASGYMIIPALADGNYNFSVGFAKNAFPEQSFEFVIDKKDLGFNLKNFGEKGWGLFNLQSLNVTMAGSSPSNEVAKAISEKEQPKDDFEPLISFDKKSKETVAKTAKAADTVATGLAATNDRPAEQEVAQKQEAAQNNAVGKTENNNAVITDVKKVSEIKDEDGVHLAYKDDNGKNTDTIHIIIPSEKSSSNTENSVSSSETSNAGNTDASSKPVASENVAAARDSLKFLDINPDKSKTDAATAVVDNNTAAITNSKCKNIATDEDFIRVRRKMAMQASDEKMINEAKKLYRNKCLTTSQIKTLSTLFLSDEGRYNFINASYNSASDVSEYSTLQSEFIDPAFVNRFKAMLQ